MAQKEAELNDKYVHLQEMELHAKNGFPQFFEEKFAAFKKQLAQREAQCVSEETLEAEKEKLRQERSLFKGGNQRTGGMPMKGPGLMMNSSVSEKDRKRSGVKTRQRP
jgi:hypothetical protein